MVNHRRKGLVEFRSVFSRIGFNWKTSVEQSYVAHTMELQLMGFGDVYLILERASGTTRCIL